MIQELEIELIDRLESLDDSYNLKVINAPDANQTVRASAIALVFYSGSSFGSPRSVVKSAGDRQLGLKQSEQLSFSIVVELVDLRCHSQSYPLIEAIADKITGYRPIIRNNFDVFYPTSIEFVALEDGARYVYRLNFTVNRYP